MILEYKSIHSFIKYLLRDKAPSKTKEELSFPAATLQPVTHSPEHRDPSSFYYHLPFSALSLVNSPPTLALHQIGIFFPLFNDLEITLLISIFLVVAIKF